MTFQLQSDAAQMYEKVLVPYWFDHWAKALLDIAKPDIGDTVLDIACGTGVTTRLAKKIVGDKGKVSGLDVNASMLIRARELADGLGINWIESDVCDNGLNGSHYDIILSQQGYQYFPDKPRALRELYRLLSPGGKLIFSVWDGQCAYTQAVCDALKKYISPEVADVQRRQRETPSRAELEYELVRAGYIDVKVERHELLITIPPAQEFVPLHLACMPIGLEFQKLDETKKQRFIKDVEHAMEKFSEGAHLVYPDAVNVAISSKDN